MPPAPIADPARTEAESRSSRATLRGRGLISVTALIKTSAKSVLLLRTNVPREDALVKPVYIAASTFVLAAGITAAGYAQTTTMTPGAAGTQSPPAPYASGQAAPAGTPVGPTGSIQSDAANPKGAGKGGGDNGSGGGSGNGGAKQ